MTTEIAPTTSQAYLLQPDEGHAIDELRLRMLATEAQTGGALMATVVSNPGPGGPALHVHHAHDELYYVLQGTYRFQIGNQTTDGGPGTFVWAPRGTIHTFASVGPEEGKIFAMSFPGLEAFLERMARLPLRGSRREGLTELFNDFDSEIIGPPIL